MTITAKYKSQDSQDTDLLNKVCGVDVISEDYKNKQDR